MVPKLLSLIVDKILKPMRSTFEDVIYAIQGGSNLSIDDIRIHGIGLELACSRGSCGGIFSHANIFNDILPH